jgi:molybdenum cofactor cytidylyltransferase
MMRNKRDKSSTLIILAAGNSSRLGSPKQLLKFNNETLLQNTVDAALKSQIDQVVVVIGAYKNEILHQFKNDAVKVLINDNWSLGMGNSLKFALNNCDQITNNQYVIVCVSDQPHLSSQIINNLISKFHTSQKGIVACSYNDTLGVPVLFDSKYFAEILKMKDEEGAKKIVFQHLDDVEMVDFSLGHVDIDTLDDYEKLIHSKSFE